MSQKNGQADENNTPRLGGRFGRQSRGTVVKPKNFKRTLHRIWFYLREEKRMLTVVLALTMANAMLTLAGPYLIGISVDAIAASHGVDYFNMLQVLLIILASTYIAGGLLATLQGWLLAGISQRIVKSLRRTLFEKMQKLPIAYFDTHSHGDLMSRLTNDIDNISDNIAQSSAQLMAGSIAIVGSFVMMVSLNATLTLAGLITVPLVYWLTRIITAKTGVLFKEQQDQLGSLNAHVEETISGLQVIKAFNHEEQAIDEFGRINAKLCQVGLKAQIWSGFLMPIMNVINNIGFAAIAITGGILAVNSAVSIGVIASFLSYSRQFVRPLNELANIFNSLQSGVAGAERVFEVFDEQEETQDVPNAAVLTNPKGHVVFENVNFGYRPDKLILTNISLEAKAGSSVAFVGSTGAGKTTLITLLTRFYDVTGGRIILDGRDIREYTRDSLRKCFGIVLQDTYLFSGTIKENIKYGKPDATDKEIQAAAVLANADAFIKVLPRKYETLLSENGGNLSQGQRQLLAIARVILAKPAILILDEATSSIDTRTERYIQDALLQLMKGRTTFIIAHRLNTIRNADEIIVINKGEIVEKGSHNVLMNKQGIYYQMFFNQFKNIEEHFGENHLSG
jgi:ATP-binding cassette subfamily B protein